MCGGGGCPPSTLSAWGLAAWSVSRVLVLQRSFLSARGKATLAGEEGKKEEKKKHCHLFFQTLFVLLHGEGAMHLHNEESVRGRQGR